MNPHAVLGVPVGASPATVRSAYRRLVRTAHPDVGGDPEAFRRIVEAHDFLVRGRAARQSAPSSVTFARRAGSVALARRWARRTWDRSRRPRVL